MGEVVRYVTFILDGTEQMNSPRRWRAVSFDAIGIGTTKALAMEDLKKQMEKRGYEVRSEIKIEGKEKLWPVRNL